MSLSIILFLYLNSTYSIVFISLLFFFVHSTSDPPMILSPIKCFGAQANVLLHLFSTVSMYSFYDPLFIHKDSIFPFVFPLLCIASSPPPITSSLFCFHCFICLLAIFTSLQFVICYAHTITVLCMLIHAARQNVDLAGFSPHLACLLIMICYCPDLLSHCNKINFVWPFTTYQHINCLLLSIWIMRATSSGHALCNVYW